MEQVKVDSARHWLAQLQLAKREDEKWCKRGKKIVRRYRDERQGYDSKKRYNVLWANIQTMLPALYGKTPRAQVERRWKDQDPVARTASTILERALQFEIDHYGDFDASVKGAVLDRLLPGRGTVWVRFETKEMAKPADQGLEVTDAQPELPAYEYECTPVDYVYWEDFRCSPARCWDEVTWVARRVYMGRKEGEERFGEDFKQVPLTHEPVGMDDMKERMGVDTDSLKKAQVWEIWDKPSKTAIWIAEGYDRTLDEKADPYGLDSFWPCPRPVYATQTTDSLVPVPDYSLYQDQAEELDMLTQRIGMLTEAVKVVGLYDASQSGIQRMLSEGVNNTMIPVDSWAAFAERGGIQGSVQFMPLMDVIQALQQCYVSRQQTLQVIYEITGLSDIIRGASVASETATAQQIKSQYASLRLKRMQIDVAQFASEVLRIKAQLMADLYSPQTLIEMSGIMGTQDAQFAEQAVMLLKSEPARNFRIEVASDSLVEMDEATEKQTRMEFLQSVGGFMQQSLPVVQQAPEMAPLIGEMILFAVRAFKGGRPMEAAFDDAVAKMNAPQEPQQAPPDPETVKAQAQAQVEQGRMQIEQAKLQQSSELEQVKMQGQAQIEAAKLENARVIEEMRQAAETERVRRKAELDRQTRLEIAAMDQMKLEAEQTKDDPRFDQIGQQVQAMSDMSQQGIADAVGLMTQVLKRMSKPRRKQVERGPDGRAIGVIEVIEPDEEEMMPMDMQGSLEGLAQAVQMAERPRRQQIERGPDGRAIGVIDVE